MKKKVFTIISIAFIFAMYSEAFSKVEVVINKTSMIKLNDKKSKVTIQECQKYLGLENYNFINEIYSDKNVALLKYEEELKK